MSISLLLHLTLKFLFAIPVSSFAELSAAQGTQPWLNLTHFCCMTSGVCFRREVALNVADK